MSKTSAVVGAGIGAGSGALTGAQIGTTIFPGIGTAAGTGIGALIGGLAGWWKGKSHMPKDGTDLNSLLASLTDSGASLKATGDRLSSQGEATLTPILHYFKQLAGGDEATTAAATRPQRRRVIDQYDTARQMIGEFSPRGGGSNAALAGSRFSEASDIADLSANARNAATTTGANIGTTLEGLGLSAQQLRSADLNTVVQAILQKRGQNAQAASGVAEGLGQLLGLILTRQQGGGSAGSGGSGGANWSDLFNASASVH